jgi:lambda repressor-like predicted transcriptional regulator
MRTESNRKKSSSSGFMQTRETPYPKGNSSIGRALSVVVEVVVWLYVRDTRIYPISG